MGARSSTRGSDLVLLLSSAGILALGVAAFVLMDPAPASTDALTRSRAADAPPRRARPRRSRRLPRRCAVS